MDWPTVMRSIQLVVIALGVVELWWSLQLYRGAVTGNRFLGRKPLTTLASGITLFTLVGMFMSAGALRWVLLGALVLIAITGHFVRAWEESAPRADSTQR